MPSRVLGRFYQLPAFIERQGNGYLAGGVLASPHCIERHGSMQMPWGTDIHQVEIFIVDHGFPTFFARVFLRFGQSGFHKALLGSRHFLRHLVAQRLDLYALDVRDARDGSGPSLPKTYKTYAHFLDLRRGIATHVEALRRISDFLGDDLV